LPFENIFVNVRAFDVLPELDVQQWTKHNSLIKHELSALKWTPSANAEADDGIHRRVGKVRCH
jgi:hypothetical protein